MSKPSKQVKTAPDLQKGHVHYPFWFGGSASCCAAFVTHPLDLGMCRTVVESKNLSLTTHLQLRYG